MLPLVNFGLFLSWVDVMEPHEPLTCPLSSTYPYIYLYMERRYMAGQDMRGQC